MVNDDDNPWYFNRADDYVTVELSSSSLYCMNVLESSTPGELILEDTPGLVECLKQANNQTNNNKQTKTNQQNKHTNKQTINNCSTCKV